MTKIEIYTDGACSYNPGPGGWAAILIYKDVTKEISGGEKYTTNNKMELTAVIKALECIKNPSQVNIYSDSAYIVNCMIQGWYLKWQTNGWQTSSKKNVENKDLWKLLIKLIGIHKVNFIKVKGHSNVELNNRCDLLAKQAVPVS